MAELHRFKDLAKTNEDRAKPIPAQKLDENFTVCRLRIEGPLNDLVKIQDQFPKSDELKFAFEVPSTGTYVLGFVDGELTLLETEDC